MSEQTPQPEPVQPQPQQTPQPSAVPPIGEWFAPRVPSQRRDPAEIVGEVQLKPMEPMKPMVDLGAAIAKGMEPTADMMPHLEGPMLDVGDHQQPTTPMFRRGPAPGYSGMVCPIGSIGNCIYCASMPCATLKAKVLEVVALEYKLLAGQKQTA